MTTVFPRQGHYAHAADVVSYAPPDITVERIGDLVGYNCRRCYELDKQMSRAAV